MGEWPAIVAVVAIGLILLDRLAVWMESRGWIYWRKQKPAGKSGGGGMAGLLTDFQQLVEPQVRHVIQDREERRLVRLSHSADSADEKQPDSPSGAGD